MSGRLGPIHGARLNARGPLDVVSDVAAADAVRHRLHEQGIVPLTPDDHIRPLLDPGECVVAVRRGVTLERRVGSRSADDGLRGDLYVTTCRLLLVGHVQVAYLLADVHEIEVAAGGVRLVVERNSGVDICVGDPRVLRVEIAAVREAIRLAAGTLPSAVDQRSFR